MTFVPAALMTFRAKALATGAERITPIPYPRPSSKNRSTHSAEYDEAAGKSSEGTAGALFPAMMWTSSKKIRL